ncbi:conjugal transfer protein TrbF, partial [Escherichia coli]|nr:conjugal transfer protein TrbF [Escherichia coli]MCC4072971.1 conjugal transfer protein TrbF [Escherichia coli]MCC4090524.1 conjugal transfer protein TrbF [Escherichia coli]
MTANKKNQEFKIRKIRRNIEYSFRDSDRYFDLFIVFLVAGIVLWAVMHVIFDVC